MLKDKYIKKLKQLIQSNDFPGCRLFIFGSSLNKDRFADIDLGILGDNIVEDQVYALKDRLEESTFPYKVDIINFNVADEKFKKSVFERDVLWIT